MNRFARKKINEATVTLNYTLTQMDLIDIYKIFIPKQQTRLFSHAHGGFLRINHFLGHKTSLTKSEKTEVISSILSKHQKLITEKN